MYAIYHVCLALSVIIILWAMYPSRRLKKDGTRSLGRMEKTLHSIYNSCGSLNNSVCCQIQGPLSEELLTNALHVLQKRHSILQTNIETVGVTYPEFQNLRQINGIPLLSERRSTPNEWTKVLQKELNTNFKPHLPLIRCTILQPVDGRGSSDIILTARADMVDLKSVVMLLSELLEIYTEHKENPSKEIFISQPKRIPPATDSLLPPVPAPLFFLSHCFGLFKRHAFKLPDTLPHTNLPERIPTRKFGWTTQLIIRNTSVDVTHGLVARAMKKAISLESLCFVAMMLATARTINHSNGKENIRLWGILIKDMRQMQKRDPRPDVGVWFSLLDFVCCFDGNEQLQAVDGLWNMSKKTTKKISSAINLGSHLSSMVFTEYISYINSLYSKYFTSPSLCPSFGLHFMGNIDGNDEGQDVCFSHLRNNKNLPVQSFTAANTSATSFPLPTMTCYVHNGKLCSNLSYSSETSSNDAMNLLMDEFTSILTSL